MKRSKALKAVWVKESRKEGEVKVAREHGYRTGEGRLAREGLAEVDDWDEVYRETDRQTGR